MFKTKNTIRPITLITMITLVLMLISPAEFTATATPHGFGIGVDFEDGTTMGFEGRDGDGIEVLTVTDELAYSGKYSLLTTGRTKAWHGPSLNVTEYVVPGEQTNIYVKVHAKTPEKSNFRLSTQIGQGSSASYHNLLIKEISVSDGWVEMSGSFVYPEDDYITIYVENDTATAEFYIDEVVFIAVEEGRFIADLSLPSLAGIYSDHFLIGSAFSRSDFAGERFELMKHHFNVMTAGNAMKPDALTGSEKHTYSFERADAMLLELDREGILVHGHALVWHSQSRDWLNKNPDGSVLTREEARVNLKVYIDTVAGHFAGRVISWDVVNEAFQTSLNDPLQGNWRSALRRGGTSNEHSAWYGAYANGADAAAGESGADYIYDAFVFARIADPNAILYYNDFNETERGKREAIAQMTEELNEKWKTDPHNIEPDRLLIEGLGLQGHYWTNSLDPRDVEDTINRWGRTGAELSITELDIPAGNWNSYKELDAAEEHKQARLYAELFMIFKKHSDNIARVTFWGLDDGTSWRRDGSPLLFNREGTAKQAFFAVTDPAAFLAGTLFDQSGQDSEETTETPPTPATPAPSPPTQETPPPDPVIDDEPTEETPQRNTLLILLISAGAALVAMLLVSLVKKKIGLK